MKILKLFVFSLFALGFYTLLSTTVKAQDLTYTYPKYNVSIQINKDSTFTVKEDVSYKFYGLAHGLLRDLTLYDPQRDTSCTSDSGLTCGGFDRVEVISIHDDKGNDITKQVSLTDVTDDNGKESMEFRWAIWPNGKQLNGDVVGWVLEYKVFGGIQPVGGVPYFYWNILPENRGEQVESSKVDIEFPNNVIVNQDNFQVYSDFEPKTNFSAHSVTMDLANLYSYGNLTASYQFADGDIILPGNISYTVDPTFSTNVFLDDIDITNTVKDGTIKSVGVGPHKLRFEHVGYQPKETTVNVESGKTATVNLSLTPEGWMSAFLILNTLMLLCGCLLIPLAIVMVYLQYRRKGRDQDMPKTIIPLYNPPENVRPYLLGTLKDETVDKEDIVGTIIDLAYRGYIKIKEIDPNKNYLMTKLEGKKGDPGLDDIETDIMDAVFGGSDQIETQDMRSTFPLKYGNIESEIYKLLVTKGYFARSPRTTIGMYVGIGLALMMIGTFSGICFSIFVSMFLGVISIFTPGFALAVFGLGLAAISKWMPAKTALGSKIYADILGFKMYLNTADRFRLQKLGPDEFERNLAYAVVFKIEKEWAKKFDGIYNGVPDWYEGSGTNFYDAVWVSSFVRGFTNSTITNMTPVASSSSGGGWSGGGSFGGFSGGGGGGGSSGAW